MPQPLLKTKLHVPRPRPELVPRPRLIERLTQGLTGPLTVISAPAGSGKTTLVSEWRVSPAGQDAPLAWLSLDEDDNDRNDLHAAERSAPESLELLEQGELSDQLGYRRMWLTQGQIDLAARWAHDCQRLDPTEYLREFEDLTLVRVLLSTQRLLEAIELLDKLLPSSETAGHVLRVMEMRCLRAIALYRLGKREQACDDLAHALGWLPPA